MTCFECFRHTCDGCDDNNPDPETWIQTCDHCELTFCDHHGTECYGCNTFHCQDCAENVEVGSAQSCDRCNYSFCTDCCIKACTTSRGRYERAGHCEKCLGLHFPVLARQHKMQSIENKVLRNKSSRNDELTEENKQLREEVEELRKKMSSGLGILA